MCKFENISHKSGWWQSLFYLCRFLCKQKDSHAHAVARLDANEKHNTLWQCEFFMKGHTQVEI